MLIDSHVHVVGPPERYKLAQNRAYLPGLAPLAALRGHAAQRGIGRFVIVQPSFYGFDNSLLVDCLMELGENGRGVAMIDPDTCDLETLTELARAGVRGLRVNLYTLPHGGTLPPATSAVAANVDAARGMGWHVAVIAPLAVIAANADMLAQAPVDIVFDHYALHAGFHPGHGEGRAVMDLIRQKHVWVKFSAPYRCSADELAITPDRDWLEALLDAAPDRCVWGSDWPFTPDAAHHRAPHLSAPYRALRYEDVVDGFVAALGEPDLARRVMLDNPARLYGFAEAKNA